MCGPIRITMRRCWPSSVLLFDDPEGRPSPANLISVGLFADGAAAAIVSGSKVRSGAAGASSPNPGHRLGLLSRNRRCHRVGDFSKGLETCFRRACRTLSGRTWPATSMPSSPAITKPARYRHLGHVTGPAQKVFNAIQDTLALRDSALEVSWECLKQFGNLSSASVLLVLDEVLTNRAPEPGTYG